MKNNNFSAIAPFYENQEIVNTPTQGQLNNNSIKVGFDMKMT